MIDDKKRREVAYRLKREAQAWRDTFPGEECDVCDALSVMKDLCSFIGVGGAFLPSVLFQRLADLINRPTCVNLSIKPSDEFLCSECGEHVDIAYMETTDDYHAKFCPRCGAEVME